MLAECEINRDPDEDDVITPVKDEDVCCNGTTSNGDGHELNFRDQESQAGDDYIEELIAARLQAENETAKLKNEVERLNKTNNSMVMKYANSEKEVLRHLKELENANKQVKALMKDTEAMNKKNKMLSSERERLISMVDSKIREMQTVQKECDRLKDDVVSKDFKIKWTLNKLDTECEEHKDTKTLLAKCQEELLEAREEANNMRKDCQEMIATCSPEPSAMAEVLVTTEPDQESGTDTPQQHLNPFQKEIETLKTKHRALIEENNSLSCRVQTLQHERLEMEQKVTRLQESNADHLHQVASLQSDLAAAESLRVQLSNEQDRVASLQAECDQLRRCNSDLLADMGLCRKKEAELLTYTQQVTEKNVALQSEFTSIESKSLVLEIENQSLSQTIKDLEEQIKTFERIMSQEKKGHTSEKQSILDQIENERSIASTLRRQLDEARGEMTMLKKKHAASLRELTRELQLASKFAKEGSDRMSQSSRTSSSTSLNNLEAATHKQVRTPELNGKVKEQAEPDQPAAIPDQQMLVERIVKLQRNLVKRQEKIDFLQEHERLLMADLQKKTKIIQAYCMSQEPGALANDSSDQNRQELGKQLMAEVVKHGGIMASVYASKQADYGLTLELSLEINKKLQVILEDTLLKNITLKNNINTLGDEIEKLTETNRKLVEEVRNKPT